MTMDFAFISKMICDLSLWFGTAGFFLSFFGIPYATGIPTAAIVLSGSLCNLLKNRKTILRLLPLILLIPVCVINIKDIVGMISLLPPVAYCIWLCATSRFSQDYEAFNGYFKSSAIAALIFVPVAAMLGGADKIEAYTFTNFVIFLLSGTLTLRILRHDEYIKMSPRLLLFNLAFLSGCCVAALFLSSDFFYYAILVPFGKSLSYLLDIILWVLSQIPQLFTQNGTGVKLFEESGVPVVESVVSDGSDSGALLLALTAGVILIFIILLIRRLLVKRLAGKRDISLYETRSKLEDPLPQKERRSVLRPHSPRETVRWYYRLFLQSIKRTYPIISPYCTSEMILQTLYNSFDSVLLSEFRAIYIVARYSPSTVTKDDAKRARVIYCELKKLAKTYKK